MEKRLSEQWTSCNRGKEVNSPTGDVDGTKRYYDE
ncbi:hypothetical protein A2U01_0043494, partial [Trifolium medium]|nr:hypothetical protein [Trifolium medium]